MKYYYVYKYKNGALVGGHSLEKLEFYDNFIKLTGFDNVGDEKKYWGTILDMNKIEYLKITSMENGDEE